MPVSFRCLPAIFLIALSLGACAQNSADETTAISDTASAPLFDPAVHVWPHELGDVPLDPDVTYGVLPNGLRYAIRSNNRPEQEASLRLTIRAGAKHETAATSGAAHFLEHMAFNGTENVPEGEMVKSLERMGLAFGADTNASTSFTRTDYRLTLPEVDDETVDYALFIMREVADKMLIEPDAVDRERGIVKAEQARRQSPRLKASEAFSVFTQPEALYNSRPIAGTPESLDAITDEDLRAFYSAYYRPERAFLTLVGDVDIAAITAKFDAVFSDWNNDTTDPEEPDYKLTQTHDLQAMVYDDDELTTSVTLYRAESPTAKGDTLAGRREGMIRSIATNIVRMRISKKMLDTGRPVLGGSLSYSSGKFINTASLSASALEDDWPSAITFIDAEVRTALKFGFQQAELDELIANSRRSLTDSVNYAAKRSSSGLLSGINGSFSSGRTLTTPAFALANFEEVIPTITLADLEAAFKKMWDTPANRIWLSGPEVDDVTPEDVLMAYETARNAPLKAPAARKKLEFAYTDFGTPGKIASRDHIDDFGITHIKFENNVRLNLKKTDFEDGWIRLRVTVGEGWNAFPADNPALSQLANALTLGGYKAHKVSELSEIFAGKNIGLNFGISSERSMLSGSTNPDNAADQLRAWAGLITAPGYRPEWREKFTENIEASFHTIDSTPAGVAGRDLSRIWHDGNIRYGMRPKAEYMALTLEEVRAVMQPIFEKGAIEIGIVGDFDEDAILKAVSETFGALPARNETFKSYPEAFKATFPKPNRVPLTHTGEVNQGAIYMAWPLDYDWTVERSREFSMISRILRNRMTDVVREELALAYSPSASVSFSRITPGYGYASASISADPQYFGAFETAVKSIAADLRAGGITEDELNRAIKPVLESFERGEKENGAWLGLVTTSQTKPEGLDWRRSRRAYYEAMTPKQLDAAAALLFDPATLHIVEITAEEKAAEE